MEDTGTHERDIPSITSNASEVKSSEFFSGLSFALATSLAVAKRLTWEQTPWVHNKLEQHYCQFVADYISITTGHDISWHSLQYAFLFGETYRVESHDAPLETYPQLLLVFPHLRREVSQDETFLRTWHDDIVRPSFDRAWEDSGLVEVYGANRDFISRINLVSNGRHHAKEANPAAGIIHHLRNGGTRRVCTHWPEWHDHWGPGYEGKFSDTRARIFDEAWKSIAGMLKDYPGLQEFQDPILLVVRRGRTHMDSGLPIERIWKSVGQEWDTYLDARYIVPGTFKVIVEAVLGDSNPFALSSDEESETGYGVQFKRTVESGADTARKRPKLGR